MKSRKLFLAMIFALLDFLATENGKAAELSLDLASALQRALRDNPEIKAKRHELGSAQGRVQQAALLFQSNPRLSVEFETPTSGKTGTSFELNLQQELEITGQRGYRAEAAEKNLSQARFSIENAERLLRLSVARAFYNLLAAQQSVADLAEVVAAQESLLQTAEKRFARQDITILELHTLRLDRDQARNELANRRRERILMENELRGLVAAEEPVAAAGNLLEIAGRQRRALPGQQQILACGLASRADLKVAKLAVEAREAEVRLAQARKTPNISLGPRYKRDAHQNIVGGEIAIALPFFTHNQEEIASALTNQNISRTELAGRTLAAKQRLESTYAALILAAETLDAYGSAYLGDLKKTLALARKAYESDVLTIFEYSVTRERFTQAKARSHDAALAYMQTVTELESQAPGCLR